MRRISDGQASFIAIIHTVANGLGICAQAQGCTAAGRDRTAGDRNVAAAAIFSAADPGARFVAVCYNCTAGDRDRAAVAIPTAADPRTALVATGTTHSMDRTAGDRNCAAMAASVVTVSGPAADGRSAISTVCRDRTAGDCDPASIGLSSAADSRAVNTSCDFDISATDPDIAACFFIIPADTGTISVYICDDQFARTLFLPVNSKRIAFTHVDAALDCQRGAVAQDEDHIVFHIDPAVVSDIFAGMYRILIESTIIPGKESVIVISALDMEPLRQLFPIAVLIVVIQRSLIIRHGDIVTDALHGDGHRFR